MRRIAVLLTCHNRKAKTLACLASLFEQQVLQFQFEVFLVDDGCSDHTAEAVRQQFPAVQLITGSGQLFWNGGMRLCWQHAMASNADFYLWLNDDVTLVADALQRLLLCYDTQVAAGVAVGAVVGTMQDGPGQRLSYGGRRARFSWWPMAISAVIAPGEQALPCDYVNGNLCLVPADAVQRVGILSGRFTHSMGDFDYSNRLRRAGLNLWIAPGLFGQCAVNPIAGSIRDASIPMKVRVGWMSKPTKCPPLPEWLYFIRTNGGPFWPLLYVKAVVGRWFPKLWLFVNQHKT
jgi:GT2 family glycosyltransferase